MPPQASSVIPGGCRALFTQSPQHSLPVSPRQLQGSFSSRGPGHLTAQQLNSKESEGQVPGLQGRAAPAWGHTPRPPGQGHLQKADGCEHTWRRAGCVCLSPFPIYKGGSSSPVETRARHLPTFRVSLTAPLICPPLSCLGLTASSESFSSLYKLPLSQAL